MAQQIQLTVFLVEQVLVHVHRVVIDLLSILVPIDLISLPIIVSSDSKLGLEAQ
jgi:hypothetical protein